MKKVLSLILALVLAVMLPAGNVLAAADNGNAWGHSKNLKDTPKAKKISIQERVKMSVQEQYRAHIKEKSNRAREKHFCDTYRHWAAQCIEEMAAIGLLQGYPDGSFKPDQRLTQSEALSLVMRIAADAAGVTVIEDGVTSEEDQRKLAKIPAWVRGDADKAAKKGIIKLNRFHSAVQASRADTAVMIAKALGLEPVDTSKIPFKDGILISQEDLGYILALYQEGIIKGNPNGNFNPNSAITRGEMASILQRLLDKAEIISVTLPATARVESGQSITLTAIVKYGDGTTDSKVSWSSSDTTLATVENGVVTAVADKTGKVTITATATRGDSTLSASCQVMIQEKEAAIAAILEETGQVGSHHGKVYQEYVLKVDGEKISLAQGKVKTITLQKEGTDAFQLTPDIDSTLWFNVQRESGKYTLTIVDQKDKSYAATLNWTAPVEVAAIATGNNGEHNGNFYTEYNLGNLDLSSFTCMYQIKPDGQVSELTANSDKTLWFKTNDQIAGKHIFLIKKDGIWYSANISVLV